MTKEQLQFMYNHEIDGFYLKRDVWIGRQKKGGKKSYTLLDTRTDRIKEIKFETIDKLWEHKIDGETIGSIIEKLNELNTDGEL